MPVGAGSRKQHDSTATSVGHRGDHRLRHLERGGDVALEEVAERVLAGLQQRLLAEVADGVDQRVGRAVLLAQPRERVADGRFIGRVYAGLTRPDGRALGELGGDSG